MAFLPVDFVLPSYRDIVRERFASQAQLQTTIGFGAVPGNERRNDFEAVVQK